MSYNLDVTAQAIIFIRPKTFRRRSFEQQIGVTAPQEYRGAGNDGVTVLGNTLIGLRHPVFLQFIECYNFHCILA